MNAGFCKSTVLIVIEKINKNGHTVMSILFEVVKDFVWLVVRLFFVFVGKD